MKKTLVQKLGLLGIVSFLSYAAAVAFAPLAYPGCDWMAQAVSDLSAANAPSLALWNQLSALYNACEVVCTTVVCIGIQGQKTRLLRAGVYLFAVMEWVSAIGYRMFPLSDSGYAGAFQDVMHMAVTALVVLLSIVSLTVIIMAGAKNRACRSYGVCAAIALGMMLVGAVASACSPPQASTQPWVFTCSGKRTPEKHKTIRRKNHDPQLEDLSTLSGTQHGVSEERGQRPRHYRGRLYHLRRFCKRPARFPAQ